MAKLRDCPNCGIGFLKGKRCYLPTRDGRLIRKLVCMRCSSSAERIIVKVSAEPCMIPGCSRIARICTGHLAEALQTDRASRMTEIANQLRGTIVAMRMAEPPGMSEATREFRQGKLEGLESALSTVLQGCHKEGMVQS